MSLQNFLVYDENIDQKVQNNIVYFLLDPRKPGKFRYRDLDYEFDHEPIYVGEGQPTRPKNHIDEADKWFEIVFNGGKLNPKECNTLKIGKIFKIYKELGEFPIVKIYKENMSEQEALDLEIFCIKQIGRINLGTGPLTNLTNGGEGWSGYIRSEEQCKEISKKVKNNWDNDLKRKQEQSQRTSELHKNGILGEGEKNGNYGHRWNQEQRDHLSQIRIERELAKGEKNGMFGKGYLITGENNSFFGKKHTKESRQRMSEKNKGKIHIYNPTLNIAKNINKNDLIPEGWIRGMKQHTEEQKQEIRQKRQELTKDTIKIYNSELDIEKYHKKELPIPKGFVKGTRKNQRGKE